MTFDIFMLLFLAGIVGGAVNAVAGGGTLFTFPAFMAAGLPPIIANASSSFALTPGHISGVLSERAQFPSFDSRMWWHVAIAAIGGALGALLLLVTPDRVFTALVPALIGIATLIFAFSKRLQTWLKTLTTKSSHDHARLRQMILVPTTIYGGFFGAGTGVILMAVFSMTSEWPVRTANAVKNLLSAAANWAAIVIFIAQGTIAWPQTLAMLAGALVGGLTGGRLLSVLPTSVVRLFVIGMGTIMTIAYAWRYWL